MLRLRTLHFALAAAALWVAPGAHAGGFVQIDDAVFDASSNDITNPWFALPEGTRFTSFAEDVDQCEVILTDALPTAAQSRTHVGAVAVREVLDEAYYDTDCDGTPDVLHESTLDWYAQDTEGNVWYFGEDTVSLDFDECDHPDGLGGCTDGSWEAGQDVAGVGSIAQEGILMLADPTAENGVYYFQEVYEDEAMDMAKILALKKVDTALYGELDGCVMTKEWSPLAPGSIEHKYYCEGRGLVLVEENAGGKTVYEELVDVGPIP